MNSKFRVAAEKNKNANEVRKSGEARGKGSWTKTLNRMLKRIGKL